MKNLCSILFLILFVWVSVIPVYADSDGFGLLIKQNEQQIRMNQYEVTRQLNEQKINLIKQLNNVDNQSDYPQQNQNVTIPNKPSKNK